MNIQSLSIVVPNKRCINNCKFCVSKMHCEDIPFLLDKTNSNFDIYYNDYINRLAFARDNGCNTVMLTGTSEPQQNKSFLKFFADTNKLLTKPFRWIEIQTTGVLLDDNYLSFLRQYVGVNTISISIAAFDDVINQNYIQMPSKALFQLENLCKQIKNHGFILRLSVNLTDYFNIYKNNPEMFFDNAIKKFHPDQITLRFLYKTNDTTEQSLWVKEHACDENVANSFIKIVREKGTSLERLPYGRVKYSYKGLSVVIDDDCMSKTAVEDYKYLILQPNCHLYSRWDDTASLIF